MPLLSTTLRVVGIVCAVPACAGDPAPPPADPGPAVPASVQLVDPAIPPAVAGEDGWNYHQSADADLTGDGQAERIVLTARVEMYRGRPAWDDGQPWQVYVETPDGQRTYLYAQRLQLGTLAMRVGLGESGRPATVLLVEHLPDRLSLYEASYHGPDSMSVVVLAQRNLDPRGETASPALP